MSLVCALWRRHVCAGFPFCTANCFDLRVGFSVEALKQVIPNVVNMLLPNHEPDGQQAANLPSSN